MSEPDFGIDLSCDTDLDPLGTEVSGFLLKAQALARRLDTPTAELLDDEDGDYGESLRNLVSKGMTKAELAAIPDRINNQCKLEDGVADSQTTPTLTLLPEPTLALSIRVRLEDGSSFEFTLAITAVRSVLLHVAEVT